MSKVNIPIVVAAYIKTRNEIAQMKKEYDASVAALKELQEKREKFFQNALEATGGNGVTTDYGTVFTKEETRVPVQDWYEFKNWAIANKQDAMFKRDIAKTEVLAYFTETGELPPGLGLERFKKVSVRVNNAKPKEAANE